MSADWLPQPTEDARPEMLLRKEFHFLLLIFNGAPLCCTQAHVGVKPPPGHPSKTRHVWLPGSRAPQPTPSAAHENFMPPGAAWIIHEAF